MQKRLKNFLLSLIISSVPACFAMAQTLCDGIDELGAIQLKKPNAAEVEALCECSTLIYSLHLHKAAITKLPLCFSEMQNLEELKLTKPALISFPISIIELPNLKRLDLSHTKINFLPSEIAYMSALEELNLTGTGITSLPDGLDHVKIIDMQMIEMTRSDQDEIREQYPQIKIYFSSPCHCN